MLTLQKAIPSDIADLTMNIRPVTKNDELGQKTLSVVGD